MLCSAKILFEVCDLDGDRKVTRDELTRVLLLARDVHAPLADIAQQQKQQAEARALQNPAAAPPADTSLSDAEVMGILFPGDEQQVVFVACSALLFFHRLPHEARCSLWRRQLVFETFVDRLQKNESIARKLLNLFLWKASCRSPCLVTSLLAADYARVVQRMGGLANSK